VRLEEVGDLFVSVLEQLISFLSLFICDVFIMPEIDWDAMANKVTWHKDEVKIGVVFCHLLESTLDHSLGEIAASAAKVCQILFG